VAVVKIRIPSMGAIYLYDMLGPPATLHGVIPQKTQDVK